MLEWYDFGVYGYLVPDRISARLLPFPAGDPTVSLLLTFAVFGVGFVMRPIGSIVFGVYGDRHGRRKALSAVIFVMALSTFAIGLLPTYAEVGIAAPILLVVPCGCSRASRPSGVSSVVRAPISSNTRRSIGAGFSARFSWSGSPAASCSGH